MAKSKGITIVSNLGDEQLAPVLGSNAKILKPSSGGRKKLSKLAQKLLVTGRTELVPPDRKDSQIRSLVGPKTVIGSDDRVRVNATKDRPWRMICQLTTRWADGSTSQGTGWLAGPLTVITAGHCVYDKTLGWAKSVTVVPARNEHKAPFGNLTSKRFGTTQPWINSQQPEFDIASVHLPQVWGEQLGYFAVAALSDDVLASQLVNITGYPGDKNGDQLWYDRNKVFKLDKQRVWYETDTARGQSGAPVYIFPEGVDQSPVVVGVHAYGANEFEGKNSATRLTPALTGAIRQWTLESMALSGVTPEAVQSSAVDRPEKDSPEKALGSHRIIYIPGESALAGTELKQRWDETLFGHSMGDRSHLFHYAQGVPDIDVKVSPSEPTMASVATALEDGVPGAAALSIAISDAVEHTGENQLLYGLEHSIRWLALISRYFLGTKEKMTYRERIAEQFLQTVINADPSMQEVLIVAHGFGAVVAYDLLTTHRDKFPDRFRAVTLVTLGSPLGYKPIQELFKPWRFPAKGVGNKTTKQPLQWLDIAITEDPIASDVDLFPKRKSYQFLTPDNVVARAGQQEFFAEIYLRLAKTKSFIKSCLPPGFSAPVKKFFIASDVADKFSNANTRMDVLLELNSRIGKADYDAQDDLNTLELRAKNVVDTILEVVKEAPRRPDQREVAHEDLEIDIMHRYVAAKLLPAELRLFVIKMEAQAKQRKVFDQEALIVHHVWDNAEMRCLTHRSARAIQVGAARTSYSAYGKDIKWAVLDSGIDSGHQHFAKHANIVETLDFTTSNFTQSGRTLKCHTLNEGTSKQDRFGHGTHVSGIIGGIEDSEFIEQRRSGIAPQAKLYCYKVIGDTGGGRESSVIRALEHIYKINAESHDLLIHGVNLSIGCSYDPSVYACGHSPICKEIRRLWHQGVVVCVAAGNAGLVDFDPDGAEHLTLNLALSIGDPGNVEEAIAVGSVHATHPHSYGVSYFSSRGPTADGRVKPDCVAPGERISSAAAGSGDGYRADSGTSMASPHVSGLIAAFLSVRKEFIGEPDAVKKILLDNCTDLGRDHYHQGAGVPNLMKMLANT